MKCVFVYILLTLAQRYDVKALRYICVSKAEHLFFSSHINKIVVSPTFCIFMSINAHMELG